MPACSACIRRCLRLFATDDAVSALLNQRTTALRSSSSAFAHRASTSSWARKSNDRRWVQTATQAIPTDANATTFEPPLSSSRPSTRPPPKSKSTKEKPKETPAAPSSVPALYSEKDLQRELRWFPDPLKLADYTLELLSKGNETKALAIVRFACKDMKCIVSWNHIVDWHMGQGNINGAMKIYNEMKKRAQMPDAHTYTTLMRGLAKNAQFPSTLEKALSLYHSMFAPNSPVAPNIIHTNAMINVCARVGDTDALFGVAAKMPKGGPGAPNAWTYTTILNALRASLDTKGMPLQAGELEDVKARIVRQSRVICQEIVEKWQNGKLIVDEELVCAMGRGLMIGRPQDLHDILTMVENTMGVKNPVGKLSGRDLLVLDPTKQVWRRQSARFDEPPAAGATAEHRVPVNDAAGLEDVALSLTEDPAVLEPQAPSLFSSSGPVSGRAAVQPTCKTLSLVLAVCTSLGDPSAAEKYYVSLTSPSYGIKPDPAACHDMLRIYRLNRAVKKSLTVLQEMARQDDEESGGNVSSRHLDPRDKRLRYRLKFQHRQHFTGLTYLQPKSFRIALSTCARNTRSEGTFDVSSQMVRLMLDRLPQGPDLKSIKSFIKVSDIAVHGKKVNFDALHQTRELLTEAWPKIVAQAPSSSSPSSPQHPHSGSKSSPSSSSSEKDKEILETIFEIGWSTANVLDKCRRYITAEDRPEAEIKALQRGFADQHDQIVDWMTQRGAERKPFERKERDSRSSGRRDGVTQPETM